MFEYSFSQFYIYILLLFYSTSYSQPAIESGNIDTKINSIIDSIPDAYTRVYSTPTTQQLNDWVTMLGNLIDGQFNTATTQANNLGYDLIEFTDTNDDDGSGVDTIFYVLQTQYSSNNYWGTYVYNPWYERTLVVQSPHAVNDSNTGNQGIYIFRNVDAFFFCMNGTHRCNSGTSIYNSSWSSNSNYSQCDGTTKVCNTTDDSEGFRISDMAHNATTIFQKTTEYLHNTYSNTFFIQPHGFTMEAGDPYVILSNGRTDSPSVTDVLNTLKDNLYAEDNSLTFKIAHLDSWTRLIGTTNTQGRYINGSSDPCSQSGSSNTTRFIHIEQDFDKLRKDASTWKKMSQALKATFSVSVLPVELIQFIASIENKEVLLQWSTASELKNDKFIIEKSINGSDFSSIGEVKGNGTSEELNRYKFYDSSPHRTLNYYRLKQMDYDGFIHLSKVISFENSNSDDIKVITNKKDKFEIINTGNEFIVYFVNSLGLKIKETKSADSHLTFDFSSYSSGIYYYYIQSGHNSYSGKFIR